MKISRRKLRSLIETFINEEDQYAEAAEKPRMSELEFVKREMENASGYDVNPKYVDVNGNKAGAAPFSLRSWSPARKRDPLHFEDPAAQTDLYRAIEVAQMLYVATNRKMSAGEILKMAKEPVLLGKLEDLMTDYSALVSRYDRELDRAAGQPIGRSLESIIQDTPEALLNYTKLADTPEKSKKYAKELKSKMLKLAGSL